MNDLKVKFILEQDVTMITRLPLTSDYVFKKKNICKRRK